MLHGKVPLAWVGGGQCVWTSGVPSAAGRRRTLFTLSVKGPPKPNGTQFTAGGNDVGGVIDEPSCADVACQSDEVCCIRVS